MDHHKALGRRIVALIIDGIVMSVVFSAAFFPLAEPGDPGSSAAYVQVGDRVLTGGKAALFMLAMLVVWILYYVVLVGRTGRTIGKAMVGVRVVREDDEHAAPGMGKAFLRQFLWIADSFPYLIPGLTGFVVAMTNPRRRRIGDMAAGTVVVQTSRLPAGAGGPASGPATESFGPGPQAVAPEPARPGPAPAPTASNPPANWYPDPQGEKRLRYWDGMAWTTQTAD